MPPAYPPVLNTTPVAGVVFNTVSKPAQRQRPHFVGVWLSAEGLTKLDEVAEREGLSRSGAVRRMLAYAATKMPKGWKPGG